MFTYFLWFCNFKLINFGSMMRFSFINIKLENDFGIITIINWDIDNDGN